MGNIFKVQRILYGLSLRELSELTNIAKSKIYRAEQKTNPFAYLSYDDILMLADLFDTTPDELIEENKRLMAKGGQSINDKVRASN